MPIDHDVQRLLALRRMRLRAAEREMANARGELERLVTSLASQHIAIDAATMTMQTIAAATPLQQSRIVTGADLARHERSRADQQATISDLREEVADNMRAITRQEHVVSRFAVQSKELDRATMKIELQLEVIRAIARQEATRREESATDEISMGRYKP